LAKPGPETGIIVLWAKNTAQGKISPQTDSKAVRNDAQIRKISPKLQTPRQPPQKKNADDARRQPVLVHGAAVSFFGQASV
jgi:hypothetical protein